MATTATTRQGVRSLDSNRNGRRAASCMHVRDPQGVIKTNKGHLELDADTGRPRTVYYVHCGICDDKLGPADSE